MNITKESMDNIPIELRDKTLFKYHRWLTRIRKRERRQSNYSRRRVIDKLNPLKRYLFHTNIQIDKENYISYRLNIAFSEKENDYITEYIF